RRAFRGAVHRSGHDSDHADPRVRIAVPAAGPDTRLPEPRQPGAGEPAALARVPSRDQPRPRIGVSPAAAPFALARPPDALRHLPATAFAAGRLAGERTRLRPMGTADHVLVGPGPAAGVPRCRRAAAVH